MPFAPGAATDTIARLLGQKMTETWGQQVVVDNRGGAGGNIGMGIAANAPGDGYTILFVSSSYMVNPGPLQEDPLRPVQELHSDFQSLRFAARVLRAPEPPAKSLAELIRR